MGSSYYITFGGDRLTFGGDVGALAYDFDNTLVLLNNNYDYLKMRFITPDTQEIIIEDGDGVSSASAYVPVGSTAYWTAHGYEGNESSKWFVSGLNAYGFTNVSADTAVTTALCESPSATAYGSALLTATKSASAQVRTWAARRATFGEGGVNYQVAFSASSFLGTYLSPLGTALRTAWIPHGSKVRFSGSSHGGKTYSLNPLASSLSSFGITWGHRDSGSKMDVTGFMTAATPFRLQQGRDKCVYSTGYNRVLWVAGGLVSAAAWQPLNIITAFSSNLCTGSAAASYLTGSANAGKVYGFESSNAVGSMMNSAGTWSNPTSGNTYKWNNRYFGSNSAYVTATFSAARSKGATGNNNATYVFYGKTTANASVSRLSGTFQAATASGKTATKTASGSFYTTTFGEQAYAQLSIAVPKSTALFSNCVGYYTASGHVI